MSAYRLPPKKPPLSDRDNVAVWQLDVVPREKGRTAYEDERITRIRDLVATLGWAIAVHGSLERDIDLIAAPWTEDAVDVIDLLQHILEKLHLAITGIERKPHGRIGFVLHGRGHKAIDFSVMPTRPND